MLDLEVAETRIESIGAVCLLLLIEHGRRDGPAIVKIDFQRRAPAISLCVVVVLLDESCIIDRDAPRCWQKAARARDIVDKAGVALVKANGAERHAFADRRVDHPFDLAADATLANRIQFTIDPAFKTGA